MGNCKRPPKADWAMEVGVGGYLINHSRLYSRLVRGHGFGRLGETTLDGPVVVRQGWCRVGKDPKARVNARVRLASSS